MNDVGVYIMSRGSETEHVVVVYVLHGNGEKRLRDNHRQVHILTESEGNETQECGEYKDLDGGESSTIVSTTG